LTSGGQELFARAQAGTALVFTRAQIGEGVLQAGQTCDGMSALVAPLAYLNISKHTVSNSQSKVTVQFTNKGISGGFSWYEFGLWAANPEFPNDRSKDILYLYGNAGSEEQAVPIPATLTEFYFNVIAKVGNATAVSVIIDDSMVYLTKDDVGVAGGVAGLDEDGNLWIGKGVPQVKLGVPGKEYFGAVKKNASSTIDDGTYINDHATEDDYSQIVLSHSNDEFKYQRFEGGKFVRSEDILHTGNVGDLVSAADVGALRVIQGVTKLNSVFSDSTPIIDIINAMPDKALLIHDVTSGLVANIYPVEYGTMILYKLRANRVVAQFTSNLYIGSFGSTRLWFGQSNAGSFSGWYEVATTETYTATVSTSWVQSTGCYRQDLSVPGIAATDNPTVDIQTGSDNSANMLWDEAITKVFRIEFADMGNGNNVRVWAREAISTAFPIQFKVVR
jgi:hypothetical protein